MNKTNVKPAEGKLGVLVVGLGAVSTTFMTGVLMARKGLAKPVGSMTQYDKMRVGRGADKKYLHYKDIVPIADLNDIVFGSWDVYPANAYDSAMHAEVLKERDIEPVADELKQIKPMKAGPHSRCTRQGRFVSHSGKYNERRHDCRNHRRHEQPHFQGQCRRD